MNRTTFTTSTSKKHLAAVLILGLVTASNASAQVDVSSRNVISNSGNGQGNTIITNNHTSGAAGKKGGPNRVSTNNVIRNSGNGTGNKIVASNQASTSRGSASGSGGYLGEARVNFSNTIEDSGNGDGNLVVGSNHVTLDGNQRRKGKTIHYHNEIRKRGNGSGSVVISRDEITLECPGTKPNPGQVPHRPNVVPPVASGRLPPILLARPSVKRQVVSTRIGRQFVVQLESDPSNVKRWDVSYDRKKLLILKHEQVKPKPKGLTVEKYTFLSLSKGTHWIKLNYGQLGRKPSKRMLMEVNVSLY